MGCTDKTTVLREALVKVRGFLHDRHVVYVDETDLWDAKETIDQALATSAAPLHDGYMEGGTISPENLAIVMGTASTAITQEKLDAVYRERAGCSVAFARAALQAGWKAGLGLDAKGQQVLYVDTPNGQVSWHVWDTENDLVVGLPQYEGEWDGEFRGRDATWSVWPVTAQPDERNAAIAELVEVVSMVLDEDISISTKIKIRSALTRARAVIKTEGQGSPAKVTPSAEDLAKKIWNEHLDVTEIVQECQRHLDAAKEEGARKMQEAAAQTAEWSHMVPPDGGSPSEEEREVAVEAGKRIRALDPQTIAKGE